jgi:hypothetical protein
MNKKIKVKKSIYGKKSFTNKQEHNYYKLYKKLNLQKELVMDLHYAVGICEGYIRADTAEEEIKAWQFLIDTGMVWKLQGWFARQAESLIEIGICKVKKLN